MIWFIIDYWMVINYMLLWICYTDCKLLFIFNKMRTSLLCYLCFLLSKQFKIIWIIFSNCLLIIIIVIFLQKLIGNKHIINSNPYNNLPYIIILLITIIQWIIDWYVSYARKFYMELEISQFIFVVVMH